MNIISNIKKNVIFLMFILFIVSIFIPTVLAEELVGKVSAINNKDVILNGNVTNVVDDSNPKNVILKYNNLTLKIIKEDLSVGRKGEAAWLGFKITKPTGASQEAKVTRNNVTIPIDKDGIYFTKVTADMLKDALLSGKNIERKYEFDWNNDKIIDQVVTFVISPETIILKEKDGNNDAFNGPLEKEKLNNVENPKTSDNIYAVLELILISCFGIIYILKKQLI